MLLRSDGFEHLKYTRSIVHTNSSLLFIPRMYSAGKTYVSDVSYVGKTENLSQTMYKDWQAAVGDQN